MSDLPSRPSAHGLIGGARRFHDPAWPEIARAAEKRFQARFAAHGADLRIHPVRIHRLRTVGEGISPGLFPHDPKTWDWWGDFESALEIRRRRRFSRTWDTLVGPAEAEQWLDREALSFLAVLDAGPS